MNCSNDSGAVGFQASGRCLHNTRIFSFDFSFYG